MSDLSRQCPPMGSQVKGHMQTLQPSSPKPQYPGRHWLQVAPPTPGLQWHCPLLGWHHSVSLLVDTEPTGSHQHPGIEIIHLHRSTYNAGLQIIELIYFYANILRVQACGELRGLPGWRWYPGRQRWHRRPTVLCRQLSQTPPLLSPVDNHTRCEKWQLSAWPLHSHSIEMKKDTDIVSKRNMWGTRQSMTF